MRFAVRAKVRNALHIRLRIARGNRLNHGIALERNRQSLFEIDLGSWAIRKPERLHRIETVVENQEWGMSKCDSRRKEEVDKLVALLVVRCVRHIEATLLRSLAWAEHRKRSHTEVAVLGMYLQKIEINNPRLFQEIVFAVLRVVAVRKA